MEIITFCLLVVCLSAGAFGAKPPPPQISATSTSPTSFTITITPPSVSGLTGYKIQYSEVGGPKVLKNVGAVTEYVIEGLKPSTAYRFRMQTKTSGGNGKFGPWVTESTMSDAVAPEPVIPEAPQNLAADPATTSATLSWEAPVDNGAEITGYKLTYGTLDNPTANTATLDPSPTQTVLEGLMSNTQYTASLLAYNADGESSPISVEFQTAEERVAPPPVENIQSTPTETSIEFTWTLPETTTANEIESIVARFGEEGTPMQKMKPTNLEKTAVTLTAEELLAGTRYMVAVVTQNQQGQSEPVTHAAETIAAAVEPAPPPSVATRRPPPPDEVATRPPPPAPGNGNSGSSVTRRPSPPNRGGGVQPAPIELKATVLSPTAIRVDLIDPTRFGPDGDDGRFYKLRYKRVEDSRYRSLKIRETPYILRPLQPASSYEIDAKVVIDKQTQSAFTEPTVVFTGENSLGEDVVRDITAVQILVTGPGRGKIYLNWIPPENTPQPITGYVVEYKAGYYISSNSPFQRITVNGSVPKTTIDGLDGETRYYVRVAPQFGSQIGEFSDPPGVFVTPPIRNDGQPLVCDKTETAVDIRQRVNWMRGKYGFIGIPLPYCEDYYAAHECHGTVCFCIPGKAPEGTGRCSDNNVQGDRPYGDDPNVWATSAPCYAEYEAAREAIDEASKTGKPLLDVRLPHCNEEGYYESVQCLGTMCYCSTREGKHTGKEVPIWRVDTLDC